MVYVVLVDNKILYKSDTNDPYYTILQPMLEFELNRTTSFTFTILPTNWLYDQLYPLKSVVKVLGDTRELFRGRITNYETDVYGQRNVTCEDAMSYLLDSVFLPKKSVAKVVATSSTLNNISEVADAPAESTTTSLLGKLWSGIKTTYSVAKEVITTGTSSTVESWISNFFSPASGGSSGGGGASSAEAVQEKETAIDFLARVLVSHNSQVEPYKQIWPGNVTIDERNEKKEFGSDSIADTRSVIDNALINQFGGFLRLRYVDDIAYLDYLKESDISSSQDICAGVNLEEINYVEDTENVFSVLMPLGKDNGTIEKANGGSFFLENQEYIDRFGRIVRVKQWNDLTKAKDVKEMGLKYMEKHCSSVPITMDVKAVDLHLIDSSINDIQLGSLIRVVVPSRNIDVTRTVTKMSMDIQNPQNNSYTIADYDFSQDDSTAAYHLKDYSLTSLLGEMDKSGKITRNGLALDIKGLLDVTANEIRIQATNLAPNYDNKKIYKKGDIIRGPDGNLLKCKKDYEEISEFNPADWEDANVADGLILIQSEVEEHQTDILRIYANETELYTSMADAKQSLLYIGDSLAPTYEPGKKYAKGKYVLYDGHMYIANEDITGDTFNPSKWSRTNMENGFIAVNGTIYATRAQLEQLIADRIEALKADVTWLDGKMAHFSYLTSAYVGATSLTFGEATGTTLTSNMVYASGFVENGNRVATRSWVEEQGYLSSVTWSMIGNKPSFNTYTILDKNGNVFQLYGP